MWKRYECPEWPSLLMFGRGGAKQFANGSFITNDPEKQAGIEGSDAYGVQIRLVAESDSREGIAPPKPTIIDHVDALNEDIEGQPPPEVRANPHAKEVTVLPGDDDDVDAAEQMDFEDLTPEQQIRITLLKAGFDKATDIGEIIEEMGIEPDLPPAELVVAIQEKLAPLIEEMDKADALAPKGEGPTKTEIHRMNLEELAAKAEEYNIPGHKRIIDKKKELKALVYSFFHGDDATQEE